MPDHYVLIDFENIQPANLDILSKHSFKVVVFVGANQTKIPFDLAEAIQKLGENGQYIKVCGKGKNALDFHLAYYAGHYLARDRSANFHIISKDTGFDPLIEHLTSRGVRIQRADDLAEIQVVPVTVRNAKSSEERLELIVRNLSGRGESRPRKMEGLTNTIRSLFTGQLKPDELKSLVKLLEQRNYISVKEGNVEYSLPKQPSK